MNNLNNTLKNYGIKRDLVLTGIETTTYIEKTKVNVNFNGLILSCYVLNYMVDSIDLIDEVIFNNLNKL